MSNFDYNVYQSKINKMWYTLVNFKPKKKENEPKKISEPINYVHIIDRSGSMYGDIDKLINNVCKTLDNSKDGDYVTIIEFSSENSFSTIVKGFLLNDQTRSKLKEILEKYKSVGGLTCFSSPLNELNRITDDLKELSNKFSVILFTDGQPVVSWGVEEEDKKVFSILMKLKETGCIVSFNAIGYGFYYDKELLKSWSDVFGLNGQYIHSSEIDDYSNIFDVIRSYSEEQENCDLSIEMIGDGDIFYATNNSVKMFTDDFSIKTFSNKTNQLIFISMEKPFISITDNTNGNVFVIDKAINKEIQDRWTEGMFYRIAYAYYLENKRKHSISILYYLEDKFLIESHLNSWSIDEIGNHTKLLKKAAFSTNGRYIKGKGSFNPKDDNPCFLDLLELIIQSNYKIKYIPVEDYRRIGRKTKYKNEFEFIKDDSKDAYDISDIVYDENRLNISLRFMVNGSLKISEEDSAILGKDSIDCFIFRNHTFVKDGNVNTRFFKIRVPFDFLQNELYDYKKYIVENEPSHDNMVDILFDLKNPDEYLPITNVKNSKIDIKDILKSSLRIHDLKSKQKVLKHLMSECKYKEKEDPSKSSKVYNYPIEILPIIQKYDIDQNGLFNPKGSYVDSVEESDSYMYKTIKFGIKGCLSSLPSIKKAVESTPKISNEYMKKYLNELDGLSYNKLKSELINCKKELNFQRSRLSKSKISMTLTGQWYDDLVTDEKKSDTYYYFNEEICSETLVVKVQNCRAYL